MRFKDKVIIVTGAAQGIGAAYATALAAEGAAVVVADLNETGGAEVVAQIERDGGRAMFVRTDVSSAESATAVAEATVAAYGGIDGLVNNAAIYGDMAFDLLITVDWDYYRRFMSVNLDGALVMTRAVWPHLQARGGGAIVNISSIGATRVLPDYVVVGASKAALEAVTRYLAVELAPLGIVVNAVSAGMVRTDALQHFPGMRAHFEERVAYALARTPAGRVLESEDVAGVVAFLCSADAAMIRGQTILIDGGASLGF